MAVHMFHLHGQNIIRRMRLAFSVTNARDTHSPYAMIVAFSYMIALNGILDLHCCRVKKSSF
jgi:hypothetical protein